MKNLVSLICLVLFSSFQLLEESEKQLKKLYSDNRITDKEYNIFSNVLLNRNKIEIETRLDSMKVWGLDIAYVEERYFPKKGISVVKEYYFSSINEKSGGRTDYEKTINCYLPERYYENGVLTSKYFFENIEARESLKSIRRYVSKLKKVDEIYPLIKKDVLTAGCGFSHIWVNKEREKIERKYRRPKTPKYYQIESFMEKNKLRSSYQIPVKKKFSVIVENHIF